MEGRRIEDLRIGQGAEREFLVTEDMGRKFAGLTGDFNPLHLDGEYAGQTAFKGKIAHGMLVAGFISGVIGNDFPGKGSIYMKQDLSFLRPVRYGDVIRVRVEAAGIDDAESRVELKTDCYNGRGEKVISGTALVMLAQ